MKKLIYIVVFSLITNAFAFDFKKFFKEDLKYNAHFGFGQVNMEIENEFNSDFDFTYINFGGGASYTYNNKYTIFAVASLKKYTNLDYKHQGTTGSKSISSVYNDLYFGFTRKWKGYDFTIGWDNLNYFVGKSVKVVEPVRIDRASLKIDYPVKIKGKTIVTSAKAGVLLPVFDDVSGFDINLGAKYVITKDRKLSVNGYYYYGSLDVDGDDATSSALGLGLAYDF